MRNLLLALMGGFLAGEFFTMLHARDMRKKNDEAVDLTADDSFPASDAPAWTGVGIRKTL